MTKLATKETTGALILGVRLLESDGAISEATREIPVIIIKEGMGNKADRHFYSAELLRKVAPRFDGIKAYANHPSKTEETDRPERDVKDIVGYYHSPRIVVIEGKSAIAATLKIMGGDSYAWAWDLARESADFAKKYPTKEFVGLSINAWGVSHPEEIEGGGTLNVVDDLTEVQSADIVTAAGAGGGFRLREAIKKALHREGSNSGGNMNELLTKHGEGLKALHDQIKANPDHAKAYGPAVEALMAHHAEMAKAGAAPAPGAAAPDAAADDGVEEKARQEAEVAANLDFEKMTERHAAGKMSATEAKVFEMLVKDRKEAAIRENVALVATTIKESGIPAAYCEDLPILCAGKSEAEVKKLVEGRKALVAPLIGNKGNGAGAAGAGKKEPSKLSERLSGAGVKMAAAKA